MGKAIYAAGRHQKRIKIIAPSKGLQGDVPLLDCTALPNKDTPEHLNSGACPLDIDRGDFQES